MNLEELRQKKLVVLGLGVNNAALTAYLLRHDCVVTVRDSNPAVQEQFTRRYSELAAQVIWEIRPDILAELAEYDVLFRSPSISVLAPELRQTAAIVYSQTKLFFDMCPARIIGVTGSKGKGTTASLIYRILNTGYTDGKTYLAGNIGVDPFEFLDILDAKDVVILELSSFQLEDIEKSPEFAVVLRITPDHLDHHASFKEYEDAKLRLLTHQKPGDLAILWGDNHDLERYRACTLGTVYTYSRHQPQPQGGWESEGVVNISRADRNWQIPVINRLLPGEHNLENIIPACILGTLFDISVEIIGEQVRTFAGLPHRLHKIGEWQGVSFYDDSIATTPESCQVAMEAFPGQRIHLIAGGKDKGQFYTELAPRIAKHCASVGLLPGAATPRLQEALVSYADRLVIIEPKAEPYLETILEQMRGLLQAGDVVLLAPAAASDAPYYNYVRRAEAFQAAVSNVFGRQL